MSDQEIKDDVSLSPPPTGIHAQKIERRKIEIKFIENKTRRHVTFSKRKHGIMKKAFELSVLTGTQVLLLVVSETGLVYTFSTPKFEPIVTQQEGRNLIQACLNAPDEEEEEEEDDDEEAQRQQQAQQVQNQQIQQQQQQQIPQQANQIPTEQVAAQQGQVPNQLHQLQGDNSQHPFSMDGFPQTNASNPNQTNPNVASNQGKQENNNTQNPNVASNDPQGNSNNNSNNNGNAHPSNAVYQQYFQSSQQQNQF